jgi:hypothetical protein
MDDQTLNHFMQNLSGMLVGIATIIAVTYVIGIIVSAFKHRASLRTQSEFHNRLLEKFGSASEFTAYLQSEAGQRFFENLTTERTTPTTKILGSIQKGAILLLLGVGLMIAGRVFDSPQANETFFVLGIIGLMLGLGFLVSAAIAYRLTKAWGLLTMGASNNPSSAATTAASQPQQP